MMEERSKRKGVPVPRQQTVNTNDKEYDKTRPGKHFITNLFAQEITIVVRRYFTSLNTRK